jgi:type II secretory pathway pseudopilin PulG
MKTCITIERERRHRCAAFTLVEVMFAVGIVGFMFTAVYASLSQSFAITEATRENLRAVQILQDKTETIHLYTWDQINTPGFIPATFTNWFNPLAAANNGGVKFTGTLNIQNAPLTESYAGDLKLVTVTVSWNSGKNSCQKQMSTLVSHYGLQNYIYN